MSEIARGQLGKMLTPRISGDFFLTPGKRSMLAVASGILLCFSFPKFGFAFLAWTALAPFFIALKQARDSGEALTLGLILAAVFFGGSLSWLRYVSVFGWFFVVFLESCFLLVFAIASREIFRTKNKPLQLIGVPAAWVFTEFLRSEIPVFGFGWNLIGYSQQPYVPVIQIAALFGAYGLGFLIVAANVAVAGILEAFCSVLREADSAIHKRITGYFFSLIVILSGLLGYGFYRLSGGQPFVQKGELRIALIQGNIPQSVKWEPLAKDKILEIYEQLTRLAAFESPHMILWPEAAFPGYFNRDYDAQQVLALVRSLSIPLVLGAPHYEDSRTAFNSAYLMDPGGAIKARYDKLRLVPFGEYVPIKPLLGWLEPMAYSLGVSDFSAGKDSVVFHLQNGEISFGTIICFEDIFPAIAREFSRKGTDFLAVLTNDAWFGPTGAPYQHLQASVFRAVENGIPVVRAANTGVSAFISSRGEVLGRVEHKGKATFVMGHKTLGIRLDGVETFYQKGGWRFPYVVSAFFLGALILGLLKPRVPRLSAD